MYECMYAPLPGPTLQPPFSIDLSQTQSNLHNTNNRIKCCIWSLCY